jgi:hypothetical protein
MGGLAHVVMDRVRLALGGRDFKSEVAGYRLALADASARQAGEIVDHLLGLLETDAGVEALTAIMSVFERLETAKRERVVAAGHGMWGRVLCLAAMDADPGTRRASAALMGRVCDAATFGALRELLGDRDDAVAEAAAASLLGVAERVVRETSGKPGVSGEYAVDFGTRDGAERLVLRCVREFDKHRRKEALSALLALGSTPASMRAAGIEMRAWLEDSEHPAHMALRGMIRRGDAGIADMRARAWVWMGQPGYKSACIERVAAPIGPEEIGELDGVLRQGHLLLNPVREGALSASAERAARMRRPGMRRSGLVVGEREIERLSEKGLARLPAWTACVAREECASALEPMLCVADGLARLNTLRFASENGPEQVRAGMAMDLCFDPDARIARAGMLRASLLSRGSMELREQAIAAMEALGRSEHGALRESASAFGAMLDPLGENAGRIAARRMLRGDRAGLVRMLQATVRSGALGERIAAIRLTGRLGLAADLELELLSLVALSASVERSEAGATSKAAREILFAASAAVMVLAQLPSPAAQHAVHKCLHHPDDRVRANALDAMARAARRGGWIGAASSPLGKAIAEFKDDAHHRVRAGAARARLMAEARGPQKSTPAGQAGGAEVVVRGGVAEVILPLLRDGRVMHRVSGLWLAERSGSAGDEGLSGAVAELVRTDPEPIVRARARQTAARLLAGMATQREGSRG